MNQIIDYPDLWRDALVGTVVLFFAGGAIALVLGFIVGAMRVSPIPVARAAESPARALKARPSRKAS